MKGLIKFSRALSDPISVRICILLTAESLTIGELQAILSLSRSMVNERLTRLREAGIVESYRNGRWISFTLTEASHEIISLLLQIFAEELSWHDAVAADRRALEVVRETKNPKNASETTRTVP